MRSSTKFKRVRRKENCELPEIWIVIKRISVDGEYHWPKANYFLFDLKTVIEIVTNESSDVVRFTYQGLPFKGEIERTTTDPHEIVDGVIKLKREKMDQATMTEKPKYFIVQYNKTVRDFAQVVVREEYLTWPENPKPNQREVSVNVRGEEIKGLVLYVSEDENQIMLEFKKLKVFCFQNTYGRDPEFMQEADDLYFLVLYTYGSYQVVYSVTDSLYRYRKKDSVGYITDNNNTFQCVILQRSPNCEEVLEYLRDIKITCLLTTYPLTVIGDPAAVAALPNIQNSYGTAETIKRIYTYNKTEDVERDLSKLRADVAALIEAMLTLEIRATNIGGDLGDLNDLYELEALSFLEELGELHL